MGKETVLPKNIRQIGDIQGTDRICLEDYVTTYIRKKEPQEDRGYLGIFFGEEREEEEYVYVFIRGILEVPEEEMEDGQLLEYLKTEGEKYFPACAVQGCCVIGAYPAAKMERMTALIPEAGKLLYHLQEQEESLYRLTDGQYHRIRGYFIFYEQNPEMQEYLAQSFQEEHTEKEPLPDNAIKSFREKIKEKGIQQHTSFLRLAGSFLVITVLAVGAIAVNRVDEIRTIRELSGDVTLENEAMEEAEALKEWTEVNTVEYITDPFLESGAEQTAVLNESAVKQNVMTAENDAADEMEAVSALPGSDSFWEDTYEDYDDKTTEKIHIEEQVQNTMEADSAANTENTDKPDMQQADIKKTASDRKETDADAGTETEEAVETASRQIQAVYIIRSGDTLADICNKYYGSLELLEEICRINEISDANLVMPGQKIVLP